MAISLPQLFGGSWWIRKPRSKKQSAGLFFAVCGRPTCSNPTSSSTKKNPQPKLRVLFGGSWWIRTTEALSSRFTVCPHWPLGKAPIFICASALTALDYYSRIRWKKQALFQKYFCKRRNGKRTAAVASALQSEKNNATPKETARDTGRSPPRVFSACKFCTVVFLCLLLTAYYSWPAWKRWAANLWK